MPEWLYNIEELIGMPALLGGFIAGILILFLPNQKRIFKITGIVFVILSLLFIGLRFSCDWILTNLGLGVPFWGEHAFSDEILNKFPESERQFRTTIHSLMWTLTFRVFPISFLLIGGILSFLSFIQRQKWKALEFILTGTFLIFTFFFLFTLIEQLIGITGTLKG